VSLAESSQEYHGSKRAGLLMVAVAVVVVVVVMMMMICYTEHKGKLTLLMKIFSGVVALQDVCWDTDPQC
jgi:hypothetical protein